MTDIMRKVIEVIDMSMDCECCGTYTDISAILECGHIEDTYDPPSEGSLYRCSECSGDYEEEDLAYNNK